jgi:tight adherence protein C
VLSVGLPLIVVLAAPALTRTAPVQTVLLIGVLAGLIGLYFPHMWVAHRISARQQEAQDGFPDALDLLLVCVEAGLGLNAALHRVGQEIGKAHEVLGAQFDIVGLELRAGMSRELALRNLAERLGIDEVKSLVAILIQSDTLGTSIAQALRIHAEDMRKRRMLRAEEKAHKLPVKLSFPLVGFILPCLILTILTPAIIRIVRVLLPTLGG